MQDNLWIVNKNTISNIHFILYNVMVTKIDINGGSYEVVSFKLITMLYE